MHVNSCCKDCTLRTICAYQPPSDQPMHHAPQMEP